MSLQARISTDPLDEEEDFNLNHGLKRQNARDLSNALQIMSGIKPLAKPLLGKNQQFDTSILSHALLDIDRTVDEFREQNYDQVEQTITFSQPSQNNVKTSQQTQLSANSLQISESMKLVQHYGKKASKLAKILEVVESDLKKIWNNQKELIAKVQQQNQ